MRGGISFIRGQLGLVMSPSASDRELLSINTIRTLSMDAVQAANSGHPGTPMALAPVAYVLWNYFLRYDPQRPHWPGRDRFVLSCGHASMLLYSLLHLAGVQQLDEAGKPTGELAVPLEHIRHFRQLHSRCPGHPEYTETTGVETTTGPLGQGIGNSVGMAIAQRWLAQHFGSAGRELFDYNVYALASDGDFMEGVGSEAASLAGHLRLANLCWIYDDNSITIEGETSLAFSENVDKRFGGYGWQVIHVYDANDLLAVKQAFESFATGNAGRPTLIIVKSTIAWGAPNKQNTHAAHGSPLGEEEVRLTKQVYGWPEDAKFLVPDEVQADFAANLGARGQACASRWEERFAVFNREQPALAAEWRLMSERRLPDGWEQSLPEFPADAKGMATRASSGKVLNALADKIPWLVGGSADLAPSTLTLLSKHGSFLADEPKGRNLHFGIREHAMAAAANGMALTGLRPYAATFFVFTDYMRPSMRLAAIMKLPTLFILTHDSIGVGEDGPTHQPVEHLAALRAIPNLVVIRPADANEVAAAYRVAMSLTDRPVALVLSRQNLPTVDRKTHGAAAVDRGAYILSEAIGGSPRAIIIGTGSEVQICLQAQEQLRSSGVPIRVVSMPSWELFESQDQSYKDSVLPPQNTLRVAVEAGIGQGWERYLGPSGRFIGMHGFGACGPGDHVFAHFGFTADAVSAAVREMLA